MMLQSNVRLITFCICYSIPRFIHFQCLTAAYSRKEIMTSSLNNCSDLRKSRGTALLLLLHLQQLNIIDCHFAKSLILHRTRRYWQQGGICVFGLVTRFFYGSHTLVLASLFYLYWTNNDKEKNLRFAIICSRRGSRKDGGGKEQLWGHRGWALLRRL